MLKMMPVEYEERKIECIICNAQTTISVLKDVQTNIIFTCVECYSEDK